MKRLARHVRLALSKNRLYVGCGSEQYVIDDEREISVAIDLCAALASADMSLNDVPSALAIDPSLLEKVVRELEARNYLCSTYDDGVERYSRNHRFFTLMGVDPRQAQRKLESAHVSILGCGGIGNHMAASLAGIGVGTLDLIDPDVVEVSNLGRQVLFTEASLGRRKVHELMGAIRLRNPSVNVRAIVASMDAPDDLLEIGRPDLLVVSADTPDDLLRKVNNYCVARAVPYVNVGYMNDIAVWGPFYVPGKGGCFECGLLRLGFRDGPICENWGAKVASVNRRYLPPSFPTINAIAAYLACQDVVNFLCEIGEMKSLGRRVGLHVRRLDFEFQDFSENPECRVCSVR